MAETSKEYWVLIESGAPAEWGLLQRCAEIAGGDMVPAALLREGLRPADAFGYGAKRVYRLQGEADPRQSGGQIAQIARERRPEAILFTANRYGRMTAAFAAALLETGLAADCTQIRRRADGLLVMTRPTFGDSLIADILCPDARPQMATVRPGIYLPADSTPLATDGPVISVLPAMEPPDTSLLQCTALERQDLSLAKILVAGGKGVGSREGFRLLERLAAALGAAVGASRGAVNAGYAAYHQQIGLTGQAVQPEVYLAFGISGAVQHLAGMEKSRLIIAVNTDPHAPIFEYADYGIVGDWKEIAGELLEKFPEGPAGYGE